MTCWRSLVKVLYGCIIDKVPVLEILVEASGILPIGKGIINDSRIIYQVIDLNTSHLLERWLRSANGFLSLIGSDNFQWILRLDKVSSREVR